MGQLDLKFYLSIFLRRLPYFLVIAAFVSAVGIAVASILPPIFRSSAAILVESPQIPDELARSTVPVNPIEQIQIIEQRLMTRANLLSLADRFALYADRPGITANAIIDDLRSRTGLTPQTSGGGGRRAAPGATMIEVSFSSTDPRQAAEVTNEIVTLILQENVTMRTNRAENTLAFFENETTRLSAELDRLSQRIMQFKSANEGALPDSVAFRRNQQAVLQERMLQLEREQTQLQDTRERTVRIYEQTGQVTSSEAPQTQEEQDLAQLRRQLADARAIYSATNPNIRLIETRIAALEKIVADQASTMTDPIEPGMTELDIQLAEIDGRLKFIADERTRIETALAELDESIKATPANELALAGLERDYANTRQQYDAMVDSRSRAAIGEQLEAQAKGARFSLVEPAVPPTAPDQPNRVLIAGAGVAGGLGAGLAFVVLLELLNRSIRRPSELAGQLGIEPFATVPYIRTQSEMRWKRSVLLTTLVLIAVAIPTALFLIHTYYLPLDLVLRRVLDTLGLAGLGGTGS